MAYKINNVRVHVWTKKELKETVKQCEEAGFRVEKPEGMHPQGMVHVFNGEYCFLSALIGYPQPTYVTVRLDETYFQY